MSQKDTSKYIALILRHKPETIGITLDEHGWANVEELIAGVNKTHQLDMAGLEQIVAEDNKQRYSFNEDKTLIRANQGHSIQVDVELEEVDPPRYLYHGTAEKYREAIDEQGLIPKSRLYVHLSPDVNTATNVGARHGKPVVYRVWAGWMHKDGYKFYKSVNGVWLTKEVPTKYIKRESFDEDLVTAAKEEFSELLHGPSLENDAEDISHEEAICNLLTDKYSWEVFQQALFRYLAEEHPIADYEAICNLFRYVIFSARPENKNKYKLKRKTIVALINYRLKDTDVDPDLAWGLTSKLFHLDYCNSEYKPLEDEKIIRKLKKYGLKI